MYYIYLLTSLRNKKSYVGFTSKKPEDRLKEHNLKCNSFTRNNGSWKLVYYESFTCERCARSREKFLKNGVGKKFRKIVIDHF